MSDVKRKGLEFSINQIGKAYAAYDNLVGNTSTPRTYIYDYENNLISLRGSTIFSDYDISKKDPYTEVKNQYTTFDIKDIANYVIQGGEITAKKEVATYVNDLSWNPNRNSPVSTEGWNIYDYNSWSNYIPKFNSSGAANTNYVIYDIYSEPNAGIARTQYEYPVRFEGYFGLYQRVPLFNHAMWCSVRNNSGSNLVEEISIIVEKNKFFGCVDVDPLTNAPNDLMVYSHRFLVSASLNDPIVLSGTMGILGTSDKLIPLAIKIEESDLFGETSVNINKDYYKLNVILPSSIIYNDSSWFHFVIYWGSRDQYISEIQPIYNENPNGLLVYEFDSDSENVKFYNRKNFFENTILSSVEFTKSGIFDTNVYLYDSTNTSIVNKESSFYSKQLPFRYILNENIANSSIGKTNSLLGLVFLQEQEFLPITLAVKNSGIFYDKPKNEIEIFYDEPINILELPYDWENFTFWPKVPSNYSSIANIICKKATKNNNLSDSFSNSNDLDIIYIKNISKNIIKKGISDEFISRNFSQILFETSQNIRNKNYIKIFSDLTQNFLTKFTDYEVSQINFYNQFSTENTNQYLVLHNYLKLPKNNNFVSNDLLEPIAFQFNEPSANLISNFGTLHSVTNVASFGGTSLTLKKNNFLNGAEFEIYLEKNDDELENNLEDSANGLTLDYTARLKFRTVDNQIVLKDLFVSASKFYISKTEYSERIAKGLSTDGYFSSENIKTIQDYNLYGYAALIPDLKMGEFRSIVNKLNSPFDSTRLTEQDYENILLAQNPNLTKDELIIAKTGFGLTDSFLIIDESSPTNKYISLEEIGITSGKLSASNSQWINNSSHIYGDILESNILPAKNIKDLRSDSFIIAAIGYSDLNDTVRNLENFGIQQIVSNEESNINKTISLGSYIIYNNKIALKVVCDYTQEIKGFKVKLKSNSSYSNANSIIRSEIWSDKNGLPYQKTAIGSYIYLKDLNEVLQDCYFYIDYKFFTNNIYWIVLDISQLPPVYDPQIKGLASISNTSVLGLYNPKNNTYANFENYLIGSEIGFGSTSGLAITQWYPITSIGSTNTLIFSGVGFTQEKLDYSIRYKFELGIVESSTIGATTNLAYHSGTGWTNQSGTGYIQFHKPDSEIYGSFNKNHNNSTYILPPVNKYRETDSYKVSESISFTNKEIFPTQKLNIYNRSVYLQKIDFIASGVFNSNILTVSKLNYDNKLMVGVGLSGNDQILAGTSITDITYNKTSEQYNLHLSQKNLSSFENILISTSSNQNLFIKRANDINLLLTYQNTSGYAKTTITLHKSPTWITKWYSKTKQTFNSISENENASFITATHDLKFNDFSINDQLYYINGISNGEFSPKASLGTTFDFKFESSNGVRIYINDSTQPVLDNWLNNAAIGNSFSITLSQISEKIKFKIEFNHKDNNDGANLIGYWKKKNETIWNIFNDSFYDENLTYYIPVDSKNIHKLTFLNVSDNLNDFDNELLGTPLNDNLVIRTI